MTLVDLCTQDGLNLYFWEMLLIRMLEKKDHPTGSMDSSGIVGLLCLLVNYPSFDLETSIKQLCCVCSLKGIADKTSLEKHDDESLW